MRQPQHLTSGRGKISLRRRWLQVIYDHSVASAFLQLVSNLMYARFLWCWLTGFPHCSKLPSAQCCAHSCAGNGNHISRRNTTVNEELRCRMSWPESWNESLLCRLVASSVNRYKQLNSHLISRSLVVDKDLCVSPSLTFVFCSRSDYHWIHHQMLLVSAADP